MPEDEAKPENYHLQHLTCQALGHQGAFRSAPAPNLASKVFISEKLKPKLHLHNKKTPMTLGASAAGRGEDMQSSLSRQPKALKVTQADAELAMAGPLHWRGQGKNICP